MDKKSGWTQIRRFAIGCCAAWALLAYASAAQALDQFPKVMSWAVPLKLVGPIQMQVVPDSSTQSAATPEAAVTQERAGAYTDWSPELTLPTSDSQAVWLRFTLPQTPSPQLWYLRAPRNVVGLMTLYVPDATQPSGWRVQRTGDWLPMSQWAVFARTALVSMTTSATDPKTVYLKLQHHEPMQAMLHMVHPDDMVDGANRVGTLNGLAFGVFAFLAIMSAAAGYFTSQRYFYIFSLMVLLMMEVLLAANGYTSQRLLPGNVFFNVAGSRLLSIWSVMATAWLLMRVSYSHEVDKRAHAWLLGLIATGLALSVVFAWNYQTFSYACMLVYGFVATVSFPVLAWWMAQRGPAFLKWIAISLVLPVIGLAVHAGSRMGLMPHMELATFVGVLTTGFAYFGIFIALVLNSRDRMLQKQRESAMARTDAETGLANRTVALARMPKMLARSHRFGHPCGVLLVRWLDYQRYHADPNWSTSGNAMLHLASRMQRQMREIDTVARVDKDRFLFLVEGPLSRETLNSVATRILSSCMRPAQTLDGVDGFDLHIAVWASGEGPYSVDEVLAELDTRIEQMREGTSRRVQFVSNQASTRPPGQEVSHIEGPDFVNTQPPSNHPPRRR